MPLSHVTNKHYLMHKWIFSLEETHFFFAANEFIKLIENVCFWYNFKGLDNTFNVISHSVKPISRSEMIFIYVKGTSLLDVDFKKSWKRKIQKKNFQVADLLGWMS